MSCPMIASLKMIIDGDSKVAGKKMALSTADREFSRVQVPGSLSMFKDVSG